MAMRKEYPRPQFERENWINLNGLWEFEIDRGNSGAERKIYENKHPFDTKINVPFCPQSKLSGIEDKDFMNSVWYRKTVTLKKAQLNGLVMLNIGACDYLTTLYVNGNKAGVHKGGYVSFGFEISKYLKAGKNEIVIHAEDDERNRLIPCGKQCQSFFSRECDYTRTTGIWQTVWMEFIPETHIESVRLVPSVETKSLLVTADLRGKGTLTAEASFAGKTEGKTEISCSGGTVAFSISLDVLHLWELGKGGLYDLVLTFGDDKVTSYFGMRSISYRDKKFFLNGKSVFQRLVLDQGFYPEGIYTAPKDSELEADIDRSMAMGFNGARLHQKVFEERFLYYADKKGYIVWGEFPNWGLDHSYADSIYGILPEWLEEVKRDFNHPAIVGWCPFNETWDQKGRKQCDDVLAAVYYATKAADPTRPCIDTSGNFHVVTDIYDVHDYDQNPVTFNEHYKNVINNDYVERFRNRQLYDGKKPFFMSEYGGIGWSLGENGWGYGNRPKTADEFLARIKGLTDAMLDNEGIFAYCYTQLTDIEQEQNGLYTYDRKPKFPPEVIHAIMSKKAAVED